jgi:hypothetical protein
MWSIGARGFMTEGSSGVDLARVQAAYAREHGGQQATEAEQLLPYVKAPAYDRKGILELIVRLMREKR